jgi:hypothetical protein
VNSTEVNGSSFLRLSGFPTLTRRAHPQAARSLFNEKTFFQHGLRTGRPKKNPWNLLELTDSNENHSNDNHTSPPTIISLLILLIQGGPPPDKLSGLLAEPDQLPDSSF